MRTRKTLALALTALFVLSIVADAAAATPSWRVVRIRDGDTIKILDSARKSIPIRIGSDAPEHDQPFGARAKERIADPVGGSDAGHGRALIRPSAPPRASHGRIGDDREIALVQ